MSRLPPSLLRWLHRYALLLRSGVCMAAAIGLTAWLVPGAKVPVAGIALSLFALVSVRTLAPTGPLGFWAHAGLYLRGQTLAAILCLVGGRIIGDWPWPAFAFLPVWIALSLLTLLRFSPPPWLGSLVLRFATPGNQTALTGTLLLGVTALLFGRLATLDGFPWPFVAGPALGWWLIDRFPRARWQEAEAARTRLGRFGVRLLLWGAITIGGLMGSDSTMLRNHLAFVLVMGIALALFGLGQCRRLASGRENASAVLLGLVVAALIHPFAYHRMLGSQDAQWYMNTLADFLAQVRAGVFPVFVGQSEHLFNGGVLPVRFAPLFQHYGLLLDLLTLRTLPPPAVQNGVVIASFIGAACSARIMLRRLLPDRPWTTTGLCLLFLSCPGVLAIVHHDDLLMTWTTLPWLPLVFGGCALSLRPGEPKALPLAATALGLLWWGHAPVALWTTLAVAAIQAARLAALPLRPWPWRELFASGAMFAGIALYPMISVLAVPVQTGAESLDYTATDPGAILHFIQEAFPGILIPLLAQARSISDHQLGWSLLLFLCLSVGVLIQRREKMPGRWLLLLVPAGLQLLLLPVPGVTAKLWSLLPGFLVNPTGTWPMQRLHIIMAACLVCAFATLLRRDRSDVRPSPAWPFWLLAAGVVWSVLNAIPLVSLRAEQRHASALSIDRTLSENHVLTRYAYLVFGRQPGYYSHGHVEPLYENRFLSMDGWQPIGGNPDAIRDGLAGRVLTEGLLSAALAHRGAPWQISPKFTLAPGQRYVLETRFSQILEPGVLLVNGRNLERIYGLPLYGERFAFGAGPESSPLLPLHTSATSPIDVSLQYVSQQPGSTTDFSHFGTYRWIEVAPDALPIRVTGWIPYQAEVNAPAAAWLETPRMFQPGYRATVDGRSVTPEKSPEGLVAVPVPSGRSTVVLSYHPPVLLQSGYWISLGALLLCAGYHARGRRTSAATV